MSNLPSNLIDGRQFTQALFKDINRMRFLCREYNRIASQMISGRGRGRVSRNMTNNIQMDSKIGSHPDSLDVATKLIPLFSLFRALPNELKIAL